ncbi:MAG: MFS transporter [Candidatus Sulfotelmatobacter sp.]
MSDAIPHDAPDARRMNLVLFLLGFSVFINYIDRSNISIAAPLIEGELGLSASRIGLLLSAFFWTYACLQIPAGWLVDRFDVKWVFALGFCAWSVATAMTGILHGFISLLVIRVIVGAGESIAYPSYGKILAEYFQEERRGVANGILAGGSALGPAVGLLVGGTLVARFGWRPFFVTVGLASLLWLVPWLAWMPRRRKNAPPVTGQVMEQGAGILEIVQQRSMWGTCIGLFSANYYLYFLLTWLPFYLVRGRGLSMERMGRVGGFVFLLAAASALISGKLSDRWVEAGVSPTRVRKGFMVVGKTGVGVFLVASAVAPDSIVVWMLAFTALFLGMGISNIWAITQTLAGPLVAGQWVGVQNFMGNLAGAVGPALTGFLVERTGHYQWPFFVAAAVAWVGALSWIFVVGPVEPVKWCRRMSGAESGGLGYPAPDPPNP